MPAGRPRKAKTVMPKPSQAKSEIAQTRQRVGGKFLPKDPEAVEKKKEDLAKLLNEADSLTSDMISQEDRDYIDGDPMRFFEVWLKKSKTFYEGSKPAKEMMAYMYAALKSMEVKQEITVTQARVLWQGYEDPQKVIDDVLTANGTELTHSQLLLEVQAGEDTSRDTQELETV